MEFERDQYGQISYDPGLGVLELEWFETSEGMTDEDFKSALERLAAHAEERGASNIAIDVTSFRHRPASAVGAWRDANIIPRYNSAGVERFAFLVPPGAASSEPSPEPPGTFPTGYFESRAAIADWFEAAR